MTDSLNEEDVEEILKFVEEVIKTTKELKSHRMIDFNTVLERFGYVPQSKDSGFDEPDSETDIFSEEYFSDTNTNRFKQPVCDTYENCLFPSFLLTNIFSSIELDLIFEEFLKFFCTYMQRRLYVEFSSKTDTIINFVIECVQYLAENKSNVPFCEIIEIFLESTLDKTMKNDDDAEFNCVMELHRRFGSINELRECVMDVILKKLQTFCQNLKTENIDSSSGFLFEPDFVRSNTMLLTLLIITKEGKEISDEKNKEFTNLFEKFKNFSDFFSLSYLSYKCIKS